MNQRILFVFFCNLLLFHYGRTQDIHWSQFNDNPLNQNPAYTGDYNSDYRFIGNYRSQWKSVTIPFVTSSISVEKRIDQIPGVAIGGQFFNDVVGDGQFRTFEFMGNISKEKVLTNDLKIRFGANLGLNQRRFDPTNFVFDNQFDGLGFNAALPTGENLGTDKNTNFSLGLGGAVSYTLAEDEIISGGVSLFNINRPNQGFFSEKVKRDRRLNLNATYQRPLSSDLFLIPSIQINIQGKYREVIPGGNLKYDLVNRMGDYRAIQAGLWYRFKDAAYLTAGLYWQDFFFGVSYDINISKLTPASRARGGIEFAFRYLFSTFKSDNSIHRICPEYI